MTQRTNSSFPSESKLSYKERKALRATRQSLSRELNPVSFMTSYLETRVGRIAVHRYPHAAQAVHESLSDRKAPSVHQVPRFEHGESKAKVLLVHSINAAAGHHELWPLLSALRDCEVVGIDLPGFGASERMGGSFRYTRDVFETAIRRVLIDSMDAEKTPVHVIALSLGCEFAANVANEIPGCVASLTLLSPTGLGATKGITRVFDRRATTTGTKSLFGRATNSLREGITRFLETPWLGNSGPGSMLYRAIASERSIRYFLDKSSRNVPEWLVGESKRNVLHKRAYRPVMRFLTKSLFNPNAERSYTQLATPTLMILGNDKYVSHERASQVAQSNSSIQLERVEDARALLVFDQPQRVGQMVANHIDESQKNAWKASIKTPSNHSTETFRA